MTYELEQESIIKMLLSRKAKNVLLQLPDGLKPYSTVKGGWKREG
ncbi:MAG: hypothetical protein QXT49_05650 [Candidatus Nezhaarchaeales archaeon]